MIKGNDIENVTLPYTELLREQDGLCVQNYFCVLFTHWNLKSPN